MHTTYTCYQNFLRIQSQFVDTHLGSFILKEKRVSLVVEWKKILSIPLKTEIT